MTFWVISDNHTFAIDQITISTEDGVVKHE